MKTATGLTFGIALLAGCSHPDSKSVDSLMAHPDRLRTVTANCRDHRPEMDAETCANAAEAERRRFIGSGASHYTPESIQAAPTEPKRK